MVVPYAFGEEEKLVVRDGAEGVDCLHPEIVRHIVGGIAAETIHPDLGHPPFHRVNHREPHFGIVEVQVGHVRPVRVFGEDYVPFPVLGVPVLVFRPGVVPSRVVCHPVHDYGHSAFVAGGNHLAEAFNCPKFGVDRFVVTDAVRGIFGVHLAYGINRHEPHYICAEFPYVVQPFFNGRERILRSEHPRVYLIHHHILCVRHIITNLTVTAGGKNKCQPQNYGANRIFKSHGSVYVLWFV